MSEPGPQPTEERANNLLVKAESSFSSGLMDEAVRLYHECSRMFMRLASAAEEKPRMALFLAKASYCDFMKAYCEAVKLRDAIDKVLASGGEVDPEEVNKLKALTRLAERCLLETVRRLEKLRSSTPGDASVMEDVSDVVSLIGKKVEGFLDFRDGVEHL